MKKYFLFFIFYCLALGMQAQTIYDYNVTLRDGSLKSLVAYKGKKILFVTLPTTRKSYNDTMLISLNNLAVSHTSDLVIICIPSIEDGFNDTNAADLNLWYTSYLSSIVVITKPLYTRKTSGNNQNDAFIWLTDKDKNGHFNNDITEPKTKFLIMQDGELVGYFGRYTKIDGAAITDLL